MLRSTDLIAVVPVATPSPDASGISSTPAAGTTQSTARPEGAPGKAPEFPETADLTRRPGRNATSRLKSAAQGIRDGRSTCMPAFASLMSSKAKQKPNRPGQKIKEPRFDGKGEIQLSAAQQEKLGDEVRQAVDAVGQSRSARQGIANKVKRLAQHGLQHGLAVAGLSKGPATRRSDVMNLAELTRIGANTDTKSGPTPDLQPLHAYIDTRADVEVAAGGIRFAEAAAAGDNDTLSKVNDIKNDLAAKHEAAAVEMRARTEEQRAAVVRSLEPALDGLNSEAEAIEAAGYMKTIHEAMEKLFPRLDKNGVVVGQNGIRLPDVLASKTIAEAALRLFRGNPKEMSEALAELSNATCKKLVEGVAEALSNARGVNTNVGIANPLTRLAVEICGLEGGCRLLAEAMDSTEKPEQIEALRVALLAASAMQDGIKLTGKIALEQKDFLQDAVRHSGRVIADKARDSSKQERIAYRAVQNGIMSSGSGSSFERISQRLDAFTGRKLPHTGKRNARAASGRTGRAINWVSSVAGERTFWRKSNLRGVTADLGNNSMFPIRADVIDSLDKTASGARRIAAARLKKANGDPTFESLGRMMGSVLDAVSLGRIDHHSPVPEDSLKHLGEAFFESVESAMGPETMACLPGAFKDAWEAMKGTHPNVAHVLLLINEHLNLRDDIEAAGKPGASLLQIGARSDRLVLEAMDDFERVAKRAQTVARGDVSEGESDRLRMADLAVAAHEALVGVQKNSDGKALPSAARLAVRIDVLESVEFKLARQLSERTGSTKSVDDVLATWPEELRKEWVDLKQQAPDAGRLMRLLFDNIHEVASSAGDSANDEVNKAAASLARLQDDVHINRYEMAVADAVTTFSDVRCGRDAMAAMRSLTHRFSLGEKVRGAHAREVGVNVGRGVSLVGSHGALGMVSPILGLAHSYDDFVEMSMNGATMQMFIGNTESTLLFGGVNAGLRGMLGMDDHEINRHMDMLGVTARLDAKWEGGREWALADALVLRVPRVSQQEDQMRREVGDILCDLVREDFDGHRLEALLDRHERLSVAGVQFEKRTNTFESSGGVAVVVRRGKKASREAHDATGYGGQTYLSGKSQRQTCTQTEFGGALKLEEFKMSAQQRTEFRAAIRLPESLLPSNVQQGPVGKWNRDTKFNPQVKFAGFEYRKQLMNSGVESTVRLVTHKGATWALQTQQIREFEEVADFLKEFGPRQHQYLTLLANNDTVPGATANEKLARAHERLKNVIEQAEGKAGPNMAFIMVTRLRDEMARTYDMLSALATLAERDAEDAVRRGDHDGAQEALARVANHRKDAQALLLNDSAWTALNIQIKSKAKTETSKSASLGLVSAKTASETTNLELFFPLGKHKVGKTPNIPGVVPGTYSPPWSAAGLRRAASMNAAFDRTAALANLNLSGELSPELSGELLVEETAPLLELRPSADEQSRTQARANRKAELLKKLEEHTARDDEIRLRGTTRSISEATEQWLAVLNDKMPAFDEIRRLPPPETTGLDLAAIDPNVVGWLPDENSGLLSIMLDLARLDGIAAVEQQLQKLVTTHEDAKQTVEEIDQATFASNASPRRLDKQIALNVMEAESVAFAAATEADKEFDKLISTATDSVRSIIDSSETLHVVYREARDAAQQANALHTAVTRANDAVAWLKGLLDEIEVQRNEALEQSRDTAAIDWRLAYVAQRLIDAEAALQAAEAADVSGAVQKAQRLALEAQMSFLAVDRAFDAAQKISEFVDLNGALVHLEVQELLNAANARAKEVVGIIEAAVQRSRLTSSLSGSEPRSTRDMVSDREFSSSGSGADSPPVDQGIVSEFDVDRARAEAFNANRRAEAARRAATQAQTNLEELRIQVAQIQRAREGDSTNSALERDELIGILDEAEAKAEAAATEADTAEQIAEAFAKNVERLIEDWTEIRPAYPQAERASREENQQIPQELPKVAGKEAELVAEKIETSVVATEDPRSIHERVAEARQIAEAAIRANTQAWSTHEELRERLIALRQRRFGTESGSPDLESLDADIAALRVEVGKAKSVAKEGTEVAEVNAVRRLRELETQANQLREAERKPKGLEKLLGRFMR